MGSGVWDTQQIYFVPNRPALFHYNVMGGGGGG